MNGTMQCKHESIWLNTLQKLPRNIFWFFLQDEEFASRTIGDGSIDLDKFPISRVCQLAKRTESSEGTAHHIKQVAGDPQAMQINLFRHECTELPAGKYKKKRSSVKPEQSNHKQHGSESYHSACRSKSSTTKLIGRKYPDQSISSPTWPTD